MDGTTTSGNTRESREKWVARAKEEVMEDLMVENYQLKAAVSNLSQENEQLKNQLKSSEKRPEQTDACVGSGRLGATPVASKERSPSPDPFIKLLGQYLQQAEQREAERRAAAGGLADTASQTSPKSVFPPEQTTADVGVIAEATDMSSLMLAVLFRDRQMQRFVKLLRLLEKDQPLSEPATISLLQESLHTYLRSPDFLAQPDKLVSTLQEIGCTFPTTLLIPPKSKVAKRSSWPRTETDLGDTYSEDRETLKYTSSSEPPSPK